MNSRFRNSAWVALACLWSGGFAHAADRVEFNRDIRPIINDKCFNCHGPDAKVREAEIRFDTREGLFGKVESGQPLIVPGDPEESEIYYRIALAEAEDRMPPEDFHLEISQEEIETIKTWIEQGAPWQGHWAFISPVKSEPPAVANLGWTRNEIDDFILARLETEALPPAQQTGRETLIRRASLDLTGLPPTPDEVDDFLADNSDNAYEKVVDRLLASPHYGERMAFPWLDAARYSDTNGYQRDTKRDMWPWRDWVIQAFNENMPFDQFTIEQLAGDLLPDATLSQKIATGFNRNHRINGEGGIIPEEYAVEYVVDRVTTTSTTWMGLTMECSRCHDHKFDPISQKEFYKLYDFFNRVPEEGKGREQGNDRPFIAVPTPGDEEKQERLDGRVTHLNRKLYSADEKQDRRQREWEQELSDTFAALQWESVKPFALATENGAKLEVQKDDSLFVAGENPAQETYSITFKATESVRSFRLEVLLDDRLPNSGPGRSPNGNVVLTDFRVQRAPADDPAQNETLKVSTALADYAQTNGDYKVSNAIDDDPKTGWATDSQTKRENRTAIFVLDESNPIVPGDTVTVSLNHGSQYGQHAMGRFRLSRAETGDIAKWAKPTFGAWQHLGPIKSDKGRKGTLDAELPPEEGFDPERKYTDDNITWQERADWVDGVVTEFEEISNTVNYIYRTVRVEVPTNLNLSLGSDDAIKVWLDGEVKLSNNAARAPAPDQESLSLFLNKGDHDILIKIVNGNSGTGYYFRAKDDGGTEFLALLDTLVTPEKKRTDAARNQLRKLFRMQDPVWVARNESLQGIQEDLRELKRNMVTTMIMEDMANPRETYRLERGVYDKPDTSEVLRADVPAVLGAMDESLPKNRLGLAQWILDPGHPLTARVRVNHLWQMIFGRGLVKTSEDFGTQGMPPSHPELLDWLAVDFIESGWDTKRMVKQMVMSATYRQSSRYTPERLERDPENILLGRASRHRLSAERIRDQALRVSGLLNPTIGGPSVNPYQPDKMWSALTFQNMDRFSTNFYKPDTGDKLYRRGLYTFWKRTILPPRMQIFDAAGREQCSVRQEITNTPLQAMVLLNDPTFVEASRHLAQRMIREGGRASDDRIRYGYKLALASELDDDKRQILARGLEDYAAHFKGRPDDAQALITVGESEPDSSIAETELAAYTMLASVMLNLDEFITRE